MRRWLARALGFIRRLVQPRAAEDELDQEVRSYLEHEIDSRLSSGASPRDARRDALIELGGAEQVRESVRQSRVGAGVESLGRDLTYAVRTLSGAKGFSLSVIGSLSVGIAATVAAFAFINAILFLPFPGVAGQDRLVEVRVLGSTGLPGGFASRRVSMADYIEDERILREGLTSLERLASYTHADVTVALAEPRSLRSTLASASYFDVLGIEFDEGRGFLPDDAQVAVVSHALWLSEMGGDPEVVGRVIEVGGQSLEVIGIAPKGFQGLNQSIGRPDSDLWVPMSLVHEISGRDPFANQYFPGARFVDYVGRMRAGDDIGRVLAELEVLAPQVAGSVGGDPEDLYRAEVRRVAMVDPSDAGPMIALVFPIPILVLVVGCLNAANLFLVRASGRGHEIAVRTAIGASRWRIVRQLLFESLVLASASAAVALPLAWAGLSVSHRFLLIPMPIDMLVLSLSVITAWGVALGFGLWPAIRVTGRRPARMLGLPHASPSGVQGRLRGRRALVVVQVAVSLSLLASGTQLISTLESLGGTAGTAPDQLLMGSFDLAQLGLSGAEAETFYDDVLDRVSGLPGVAAAALGDRTLLWKFHGVGKNERNSVVVRLPEELPGEGRVELGGYAGGRFLETLGLEVMRGRGLVAADDGIRPRVGVLTAPLAEQLFEGPGIGRTLWVQALDQDEASAVEIEIVGVVEAPVDPSYAGGPIRAVFLPAPLREETALTLYVRSVGPADALRPLVREVIREVDARVPVLELASLESVQERDEFVGRGLARAAAFLGLVALLLATVGLYGVTSYVVAMRTRELAIRLAIGALPRQVLRIVLDQSLGLVALGGVIGGVIAAGVGALMQAQAFGVAGVDWAALLGSALLLVLVMLFASAVPARRAARLDPGRVLREG